MNRRMYFFSLPVLLVLSACAFHEDVGESRAAVAGGVESDNESVVFVFESSSGGGCSGTLVGSRAVLTMRYCATPGSEPDSPLVSPGTLTVLSGPNAREATAMARVTAIVESGTTERGEVVILQLDAPLPGTPVELSDVVPAVDDEVTIFGFGGTESGSSGTRREGTAIVTDVPDGEDYFSTEGPAFQCNGDAGGPVLDASGRLVGIGYFIMGTECGMGVTSYRRVDDLVTFVEDNATPPVVDAGADTGPGDASVADTGITSDGATGDGATGDTGTGSEAGGGGCDCATAHATPLSHPAALPLALFALFAVGRRLRRRR